LSTAASGPDSGHVPAVADQARLRRNALGLWGVVFLVVASAAPLTSMLGAVVPPVAIGNGIGAPGIWLLTGIILLLFAVGYAAMTRYVTNAGAFYAYIAQGLGRPAGVGAAAVALLAYNVIQAALFGLFGFFATTTFADKLGIEWGWEVWALLALAAVGLLGWFGIELSAKVLGVLLICEVLILLVFDLFVIADGGADGLAFNSFSPGEMFSGAPGIAFIFAFATFVGFEATAIYGEETKDPKRTTPKATYIAVGLIMGFYTLTSWSAIQAAGEGAAVQQAQETQDLFLAANTAFVGQFSTDLLEWLLVTSIFAALLAFHNAAARYFYVMGRERLLPRALTRTHPRRGTPQVANLVQISVVLVIIGAFMIAGEDPFLSLFSWSSGVAALGIIFLQLCTSLAVIAFFRRTKLDTRPWNTIIAPGLGAIGLGVALFYGIDNFDVLTGATSDVVKLLWLLVPLFFIGGIVYAYVVKGRDPEQYERLGHFIDEAPPIEPASDVVEHQVDPERGVAAMRDRT
jgi:amino acid transporter